MNAVNWFEIPVNDLTRAKKFYSDVFGVEFGDMVMGPAEMAMWPFDPGQPNASGALVKAEGYVPSTEGSMVYLACED